MPKLDFNEFNKQPEGEESQEITISEVSTTVRQFFVKEEEVVFDIVDLDFNGKGPGMEVLMSKIGEDFKMRVDFVPKEIFDTYDIPDYICHLLDENLGCLECKMKFLEGLCGEEDDEEYDIEFVPDTEDDDEEEEDDEKA